MNGIFYISDSYPFSVMTRRIPSLIISSFHRFTLRFTLTNSHAIQEIPEFWNCNLPVWLLPVGLEIQLPHLLTLSYDTSPGCYYLWFTHKPHLKYYYCKKLIANLSSKVNDFFLLWLKCIYLWKFTISKVVKSVFTFSYLTIIFVLYFFCLSRSLQPKKFILRSLNTMVLQATLLFQIFFVFNFLVLKNSFKV